MHQVFNCYLCSAAACQAVGYASACFAASSWQGAAIKPVAQLLLLSYGDDCLLHCHYDAGVGTTALWLTYCFHKQAGPGAAVMQGQVGAGVIAAAQFAWLALQDNNKRLLQIASFHTASARRELHGSRHSRSCTACCLDSAELQQQCKVLQN